MLHRLSTLLLASVVSLLLAARPVSAQTEAPTPVDDGKISHSVIFVFATANENVTCESINGRLNSLAKAALRESDFAVAGNWEYFMAELDQMEEEIYHPDPSQAGFEEAIVEPATRGRDLAGCYGSDCWSGCTYYKWPRHCACCTCCWGGWRRNRNRRLQEPAPEQLTVRLASDADIEAKELEIADRAIDLLEQWYLQNSWHMSCLLYPFKVAVDIDPIATQDYKVTPEMTREEYWEDKWAKKEAKKEAAMAEKLLKAAMKAEEKRKKDEAKKYEKAEEKAQKEAEEAQKAAEEAAKKALVAAAADKEAAEKAAKLAAEAAKRAEEERLKRAKEAAEAEKEAAKVALEVRKVALEDQKKLSEATTKAYQDAQKVAKDAADKAAELKKKADEEAVKAAKEKTASAYAKAQQMRLEANNAASVAATAAQTAADLKSFSDFEAAKLPGLVLEVAQAEQALKAAEDALKGL
jgi:hypothetical protein